mgnify:CR=1 FL=1
MAARQRRNVSLGPQNTRTNEREPPHRIVVQDCLLFQETGARTHSCQDAGSMHLQPRKKKSKRKIHFKSTPHGTGKLCEGHTQIVLGTTDSQKSLCLPLCEFQIHFVAHSLSHFRGRQYPCTCRQPPISEKRDNSKERAQRHA